MLCKSGRVQEPTNATPDGVGRIRVLTANVGHPDIGVCRLRLRVLRSIHGALHTLDNSYDRRVEAMHQAQEPPTRDGANSAAQQHPSPQLARRTLYNLPVTMFCTTATPKLKPGGNALKACMSAADTVSRNRSAGLIYVPPQRYFGSSDMLHVILSVLRANELLPNCVCLFLCQPDGVRHLVAIHRHRRTRLELDSSFQPPLFTRNVFAQLFGGGIWFVPPFEQPISERERLDSRRARSRSFRIRAWCRCWWWCSGRGIGRLQQRLETTLRARVGC